jgi:hypothetical protein
MTLAGVFVLVLLSSLVAATLGLNAASPHPRTATTTARRRPEAAA